MEWRKRTQQRGWMDETQKINEKNATSGIESDQWGPFKSLHWISHINEFPWHRQNT